LSDINRIISVVVAMLYNQPPKRFGRLIYKNHNFSRDNDSLMLLFMFLFCLSLFLLCFALYFALMYRGTYTVFIILVTAFVTFQTYIRYKNLIPFEIYENGILLPFRSYRQVVRGKFYFIGFEEIDIFCLNSNSLPYITLTPGPIVTMFLARPEC